MKRTNKIAAGRSYRLLLALITLTLLLAAVVYFRLGASAASLALLYGTAASLPLSLLATSLSELRELARAREAQRLLEQKKRSKA